MPINAQRIQDVFLAASVIDSPAERARFLDEACAGDTGLRSRVEVLLRAHDQPDSLLDQPAVVADDRVSATTCTIGHEGGAQTDDDEVPLGFLAPATRPDALGRIGNYEVLQVLGKGGFGIVFRAFDDILQRVVAVKVMAPQLAATSPARKRFLREARSSARVRHENVVQVYEVGETPLPYIAMEFIPGETLQERLNRVGPVEPPEVVRIGRQIAEGLAAAHATDLIHRDIKPGNILLEGGAKRVKITDFGLARAADDASISQSGIIAGTPMYMAPEQATGETLDQRADLFSLGSVLYQMACGRPPFRANSTVAVLKRVAEDTPRDIREIVPEVPQWLCDIISKLHAKNPGERFQSAREVADLLADCETQLKASSKLKDLSRIPHLQSRASSWRGKWIAVTIGLFLPLIALGIYQLSRPSADETITEKSTEQSEPVAFGGIYALRFNGHSDYVDVPGLTLDGLNEFTIEGRIRPEPPRSKGTLAVNLGDPLFALDIVNDGSVVPFLIRDRQAAHYTGAVALDANWHDIAITVSDRKVAMFVDGKQHAMESPPLHNLGRASPPNNRFLIGAGLAWDVPTPIYHFQGEIAALKISRVTRYRQDYTPPQQFTSDSDTLACYLFGEGQGTVLKDASGNGCHGNIIGATWVKFTTSSQSSQPMLTDAEVERIASLPAEQQIEEVRKELVRLNPGFDGKVQGFDIQEGSVSLLWLHTDQLTNISPIRALTRLKNLGLTASTGENGILTNLAPLKGLPIETLNLTSNHRLDDLTPLMGMPLVDLKLTNCPVKDLSPLVGMKLTSLWVWEWKGSDLRPLQGMPLKELIIGGNNKPMDLSPLTGMPLEHLGMNISQVSDLQPIKGLPLRKLEFQNTKVSDVTPLRGMPLNTLVMDRTQVTDLSPIEESPLEHLECDFQVARDAEILRKMKSLKTINRTPVTEFWQQVTAGKYGFPSLSDADVERIAALPVDQQIEEVRKELIRRNPGFDGKLEHTVEDGAVRRMMLSTELVADISPIRALKHLKSLNCSSEFSEGKLADLSPLKNLPLESFWCEATHVSDLTPLKGMKLSSLYVDNTLIDDLSPLADSPLTTLNCSFTKVSSLEPLKRMPLQTLWANNTNINDLSPLRGMLLDQITIHNTKVTDISPLKGMPLSSIYLDFNLKRDSEILRSLTSLSSINGKSAREFWQDVEGGKYGFLPLSDAEANRIAALPLEKQIEEVRKELIRRNPGYAGEIKFEMEDGSVSSVSMQADGILDLSPVRALPQLRSLECTSRSFQDLTPLRGMRLSTLSIRGSSVRDLTSLKDIKGLIGLELTACTEIADLKQLEGLKLTALDIAYTSTKDLSPLKKMPLTHLNLDGSPVADLSPLAGMKLSHINYTGTDVMDISILKSMPLTTVQCEFQPERDAEVLRSIRTLETINGKPAAEFWKDIKPK